MTRGDARHSAPGHGLRRWSTLLVFVVLGAAGLAHTFDLGPRWLGWDEPDPMEEPAAVAPPPGLSLPSPSPAAAVATGLAAGDLDPAEVRRSVAGLLRDRDLGRRVGFAVAELGDVSDGPLVSLGEERVTPASTTKVVTTVAALEALGPDHRFRTTVVAGDSRQEVVLVGGGDPLLTGRPDPDAYPVRADLTTLAKATARSLEQRGTNRVRLSYDTSLFTGPAVSPDWPASYLPDNVVSPIEPLWVDEGRERPGLVVRSEDPAQRAAEVFARALEREGVIVRGRVREAVAPPRAEELAAVQSAPLAQLVQWVLETSDNEGAEVLLRHVGIAEGRGGSFQGGAAATLDVLGRLGVDVTGARLLDGSGLSRRNRLTTTTLLAALQVASSDRHPDLRRVVAGLPVAGFTGSLTYRFDSGSPLGQGVVRAKTGTLTGVHGLAGTATTRDGVPLLFVAVADRVRPLDTLDARETLDEVAAALAACRCAAPTAESPSPTAQSPSPPSPSPTG